MDNLFQSIDETLSGLERLGYSSETQGARALLREAVLTYQEEEVTEDPSSRLGSIADALVVRIANDKTADLSLRNQLTICLSAFSSRIKKVFGDNPVMERTAAAEEETDLAANLKSAFRMSQVAYTDQNWVGDAVQALFEATSDAFQNNPRLSTSSRNAHLDPLRDAMNTLHTGGRVGKSAIPTDLVAAYARMAQDQGVRAVYAYMIQPVRQRDDRWVARQSPEVRQHIMAQISRMQTQGAKFPA